MHPYPGAVADGFEDEAEDHADRVAPCAVDNSLRDLHEENGDEDGEVEGIACYGGDVIDCSKLEELLGIMVLDCLDHNQKSRVCHCRKYRARFEPWLREE